MCVYVCICVYIYIYICLDGGDDCPAAKVYLGDVWTSSAGACLNVFPYEISLRGELRSPNISEKPPAPG